MKNKWILKSCLGLLVVLFCGIVFCGCGGVKEYNYQKVNILVCSNQKATIKEKNFIEKSVTAIKGLVITNYDGLQESGLTSLISGIGEKYNINKKLAVKIDKDLNIITISLNGGDCEILNTYVDVPIF